MKKIFCLMMIICILVFTGCNNHKTTISVQEQNNTNTSMFIIIETVGHYTVVYHKDTKVMYTISTGYYNAGTFTLLVNPDGSPMIYEEE